jgi:hypothetical protein
MNIFILDTDKRKNAQYHTDKHVVKMILEQTQVLCSAYYFTNQEDLSPYKLTHKNHPCSIWCRQSIENWLWLQEMTIELYVEYIHRYGKSHKSGEIALNLPLPKLQSSKLTDFAQAVPEQYKNVDVVKAYRDYYKNDKDKVLNECLQFILNDC